VSFFNFLPLESLFAEAAVYYITDLYFLVEIVKALVAVVYILGT
jgi:hypothetical protein